MDVEKYISGIIAFHKLPYLILQVIFYLRNDE